MPAADTAYVWDGWKLLPEIDLRDPNDLSGGTGHQPVSIGVRPVNQQIATWGLGLAGTGSIGERLSRYHL